MAETNGRGVMSAVRTALVTVVLLVPAALVALLVVVPKVTGGMSLTVLTGSMEPNINPGDIVVTRGITTAQAAGLKVGQVITFLPYPDNPMLVTHRITAKSADAKGVSFTTKGDNNNDTDAWDPVHDYQVRGQVLYTVPKLGWVRQWVGNKISWLVIGLAIVLIGYGVFAFATAGRKGKQTDDDDSCHSARNEVESQNPEDPLRHSARSEVESQNPEDPLRHSARNEVESQNPEATEGPNRVAPEPEPELVPVYAPRRAAP